MELLYAREYTQGGRAWERGYVSPVSYTCACKHSNYHLHQPRDRAHGVVHEGLGEYYKLMYVDLWCHLSRAAQIALPHWMCVT